MQKSRKLGDIYFEIHPNYEFSENVAKKLILTMQLIFVEIKCRRNEIIKLLANHI